MKSDMKKPSPYLTKELDKSPANPTAAPMTAVFEQPNMSVKTLTIGQQKKIIPMERELTHAAREGEMGDIMTRGILVVLISYNVRYSEKVPAQERYYSDGRMGEVRISNKAESQIKVLASTHYS